MIEELSYQRARVVAQAFAEIAPDVFGPMCDPSRGFAPRAILVSALVGARAVVKESARSARVRRAREQRALKVEKQVREMFRRLDASEEG
jgi:hypothetical protein